jgi:plasmid stabilization system protein ParE
MTVILSPEAVERLEAQVAFLRDMEAFDAAEWLRSRIMNFLSNYLARYPRSGRPLGHDDLREIWVPGTRLVLWYRIEEDCVLIATVWHTSQDRRQTGP